MSLISQTPSRAVRRWVATAALGLLTMPLFGFADAGSAAKPRVIEVLADKDSHYKMAGQSKPEIVVHAGEPLLLRIDARKGKSWTRNGLVHGFTLLRKDHKKVPGWDLELKQGIQEFNLTAPAEPGEYEVICTVICSESHEGMRLRFVVE